MTFFTSVEGAPDDPIFSLGAACKADDREKKVNLGVGAYKTAEGAPLVLSSVRKAEALLLDRGLDKSYLQMDGIPEFRSSLLKLLFGHQCQAIAEHRFASAQTVAGSGALRIAGEFIRAHVSDTIYLSTPTWANHEPCFLAAGLRTEYYPYYDTKTKGFDFAGMMNTLKEIPAGSVVLLQACCHNPTGTDPTFEQWKEICALMKERRLMPLFDAAYQGFGAGLEEDAKVVRHFVSEGHLLMCCISCSKNFGLYGERVGLLGALCSNPAEANRVGSQIKKLIRSNYSNPPLHGARIVTEILGASELKAEWMEELGNMRTRIQEMRKAFVSQLLAIGGEYSFMRNQLGMFSYTGLTGAQVNFLREEHAIYMPQSGRINVAGLNSDNLDHVTQAISEAARAHEKGPV